MSDFAGPYGRCTCGRPLQVLSMTSWSTPMELTCPVCDEGVSAEDFDAWMEGEEPPETNPYDRFDDVEWD